MLSQGSEWKRTGCGSEAVQLGISAARSDFVDCPSCVRAAGGGAAIEIAVAGLDETGIGRDAISRCGRGVEVVEHRQDFRRSELKRPSAAIQCPAIPCRSIEVPIGAL